MHNLGLHNQAPQYLVDLCQSVSSVASRQHLHSASRGLLVVPRHRLSSYGRRAFSVAGHAMWNWSPDSLREPAISRDSFKHSLKTFLFSAYIAHSSFLDDALYKFTYLLTYSLLRVIRFTCLFITVFKRLQMTHPDCFHCDLFTVITMLLVYSSTVNCYV